MTTSTIRTPAPRLEANPLPTRRPAFGLALLIGLLVLLASNGLAHVSAFTEAELRQLKHGFSTHVASTPTFGITANELRDLRHEARTSGTPTARPSYVFGFLPAELADLRSEAVSVEPSFATLALSAGELRDLRAEARKQGPFVAVEPIAGFTANELHDLRVEARTISSFAAFAPAPVDAFTAVELHDLRRLAQAQGTSPTSIALARR